MYDTGLKARLLAKGVRVVEIAGWQTRGSATFSPRGAIHHHTAGSSRGTVPSLNTCIFGRPDVPGPLCQVMQSREVSGDDIAYLIAAGKANHGGVGTWRGVTGNSKFYGLEVEHVGTGSVAARRHEITARILAAMMEAPGSSRDPRMVCEHFEYAQPPGRKIDFAQLNPPFPNRGDGIRARVAQLIGTAPTPKPPPPPTGDWFDMATKDDLKAVVNAETSPLLVRPTRPDGTIDDNVFIVRNDMSQKFWIGDWEAVALIEYVSDLLSAGTWRQPYNLPALLIDQIPEGENPVIGTSTNPKEGWQDALKALRPRS